MQKALQTVGPGARGARDQVSGSSALVVPALGVAALRASLDWLRQRHHGSIARESVDPAALERWVGHPLDVLGRALPGAEAASAIAALRRRLTSELRDRTVAVADLHGSVPPERWSFNTDGTEVVAVEHALPVGRGLPEVDLILVVLARRRLLAVGGGRERGADPMLDLLSDGWSADERAAVGSSWSINDDVRPTTLVLLAWLHWVVEQLIEEVGARSRRPVTSEAQRVLARIAEEEKAGAIAPAPAPARPSPTPASTAARAAGAVAVATERSTDLARERVRNRRTLAGVGLGVTLWLVGVWGIDTRAMTDLGLLSIMRPPAFLGLAVLLICLGSEVVSARPVTWRLAAPVVALVCLLHGTPALLYGTLRYSWAWKHLGILDYIHRHGSVDSSIGPLGVYHNWPGFFSLTSAIADLFGLHSGLQVARWWPVVANLAVIPVLLFVYRGLRGGADRRTAWLAVGFFLVANWIGQDYFSPQSLGFLLYLVIIGVVLQHLRADRSTEVESWSRRWGLAAVLLAAVAVVTSHQITPFMLIVALAGLAITRQARTVWLTVAVGVMAVAWSLTGAWPYMRGNVGSLLQSVGAPVSNADGNLVDQGRLSGQQVLVSMMGRVTVVAIALVAALGVMAQLRRLRRADLAALVLLIAPASLVFANSFGGEIGFRSYLFALPFLSWYAARAVWPPAGTGRRVPVGRVAVARGAIAVVVSGVLLVGFLFGYYGKDRWYAFTGDEVAAADVVFGSAPPRSLLVTVTANYPGPSTSYENLVYVPIASEPAASRARVLARPALVLERWLADRRYTTGYVLITRSQEREVEALGALPHGAVSRLRAALDASPQFRKVFASPDAQVYVLASGPSA